MGSNLGGTTMLSSLADGSFFYSIGLGCQKPSLRLPNVNLHNLNRDMVIQNIVHVQHASAWMNYVYELHTVAH